MQYGPCFCLLSLLLEYMRCKVKLEQPAQSQCELPRGHPGVYTSLRRLSCKHTCLHSQEVVPVTVPGRKGGPPSVVTADETLAKLDSAKLRRLPPTFRPDGGTVTAGTASPLSDGAAALVLVSGSFAQRRGLKVKSLHVGRPP